MKYAEITITVELDDSLLTDEQKEQANKADTDLSKDHPVDKGVEALTDAIAAMSPLSYFHYLKGGLDAVKITF